MAVTTYEPDSVYVDVMGQTVVVSYTDSTVVTDASSPATAREARAKIAQTVFIVIRTGEP